MRLDRFDLNLLVIFETVYEENNLTRAAEKLNLAQPTISNAMTRLRAVFDDPLFVRSGRGVTPTPLARQMIGPVRQSLRQVQATLDSALAFDANTSNRTFNISMGELTATTLLPNIIKHIREKAPGVFIHAFQVNRREIKDKLALGQLDLAIDIPRLSARDLNQHDLPVGDYVCALRKGHPLSRVKLTMDKLLSLDFITVSSRPSGSTLIELAMSREGKRIEPFLRTQHFLPALRIVESSDHALIVPRTLARQFDVTMREIPFDIGMETMSLYWHRSVDEDPANTWLRNTVIGAC